MREWEWKLLFAPRKVFGLFVSVVGTRGSRVPKKPQPRQKYTRLACAYYLVTAHGMCRLFYPFTVINGYNSTTG